MACHEPALLLRELDGRVDELSIRGELRGSEAAKKNAISTNILTSVRLPSAYMREGLVVAS